MILKKIEKKENAVSAEKAQARIQNHLSEIVSMVKSKHAKFIKAQEVDEIFSHHQSFSKDVKLSNFQKHTFYYIARKIYGQNRELKLVKGLPNPTGQFKSPRVDYNQVDPYGYDVETIINDGAFKRYDLKDDTFRSYQCPSCSGNRKLPCNECGCSGRVKGFDDKYETCGKCQGSGAVMCTPCEGYGSVYDFLQLEVNHRINTFSELITNNDKEKEWFKTSDLVNVESIAQFTPSNGNSFVTDEDIDKDDPILKNFHEEAVKWFENQNNMKYMQEHEYYINKNTIFSTDMEYNGKTIKVGFNQKGGEVCFEVLDMQYFFEDELNNLQDESNKRKKKRQMIYASIVASIVLVIGLFMTNNYLEGEKIREAKMAKRAQIKKEELAKEQALQAKLNEEKAQFNKVYATISKDIRDLNFDNAFSKLSKFEDSVSKLELNDKQLAIYNALIDLNKMNKQDVSNHDIVADSYFQIIAQGKELSDSQFYWVCNNISSCKTDLIPKQLKQAFKAKVHSLVSSNKREIASIRENEKLLGNAGKWEETKGSIELEVKKYLAENSYSTKNFKLSIDKKELSKKHYGSWDVSYSVSVEGETLKFHTYATRFNFIGMKKIN